ncbi:MULTISPECIES: GAF domain-containing protein [unclassified Yimella]|uniref:GAF domain-containing protein n=1 Tax=unclassified Yimella TaxID=2649892 RepID=UPI00101C018D|nr:MULTISPECIES: GAF domain-containing protein [unclassified Yimella]MCG8656471.1 GAF domain-containing protein [Yimella sp. NH-Cas1]RYG78467.1 GAF domain-containing protein [Yimella sp. RIT 621]
MSSPTLPVTPAVRALDDLRHKAADLARLHEQWQRSRLVPDALRPEVARAWARHEPEHRAARSIGTLAVDQVRERRDASVVLAAAVEPLRQLLLDTAVESSNEMVVCDTDGVVLWVDGPRPVRAESERLGFVEGARWTEDLVGVNALGTALTERRAIQLFGAEHSNPDQHRWVCTGAPIRDPASTAVIGAITLSGPLASAHPHTLSLVTSAVRAVESELTLSHRRSLRDLAGADERAALVVDRYGWVAAARGIDAPERVWAPRGFASGAIWLPAFGTFECVPVRSGWALHPTQSPQPQLRLVRHPRPTLEVGEAQDPSDAANARFALTPKQVVLVEALAAAPGGLDVAQLQTVLGVGSAVSVRAEISRLRRRVGGLLESRPYRFTVPCAID